jgi:hypothetical protein
MAKAVHAPKAPMDLFIIVVAHYLQRRHAEFATPTRMLLGGLLHYGHAG